MTQAVDTDVLVVGGGGGAARAALAAREASARTLLVVKGWFGWTGIRGGGATGCGVDPWWGYSMGRGVPGRPEEETELNVRMVLQAGLGMTDPRLARSMVEEQEEARRDLERWGAVVAANFSGSDRRRWVQLMPALACAVRAAGIAVREHTMITDLLIEDGACVGAVGLDEGGGVQVIRAGATILATGGNGRLYMHNCHPDCMTGDGYAMGYRAGAELINMEYMQIFLGTRYPTVNMLAGPWSWRHHPRITNGLGHEFLQEYLPEGRTVEQCLDERAVHNPFSTRDRCSRYLDVAIVKENQQGRGTPHSGCYVEGLDPGKISPEFREWLGYRGIDPAGRIEVSPTHQCSDGGLYIGKNGETRVLGLYAVGEVAAGMHGADRLGGHMMVNTQVFGRRAGKDAAALAEGRDVSRPSQGTVEPAVQRIERLRASAGSVKPASTVAKLQRTCWAKMLALRSRRSLAETLVELQRMREESLPLLSVENPMELTQALELENLLLIGEMVGKAALMREESRGGHYREDFPNRDDLNWLRVIRIRKMESRMQLDTVVLDPEWKDLAGDLGDWVWG